MLSSDNKIDIIFLINSDCQLCTNEEMTEMISAWPGSFCRAVENSGHILPFDLYPPQPQTLGIPTLYTGHCRQGVATV